MGTVQPSYIPLSRRIPGPDGIDRDFYIRQLWDWKASADLSRMSEHGLLTYTRACAWSLARSVERRLAILAEGQFGAHSAKTAYDILDRARRPSRHGSVGQAADHRRGRAGVRTP